MRMNTYGFMTIAVLSLVLGNQDGLAAVQKKSTTPSPAPPTLAKDAGGATEGPSGKVVETMNGGGYTYVCLEKNGSKTWVAVPETKVTVGQTMSFLPGQTMTNFQSKALERTFETIVFSSGTAAGAEGGMPAGHPSLTPGPQGLTGSKAQVSSLEKSIKVEKAAGSNAYTVSELYANRSKLNKKTVVVRGKVVKVSRGIMGRNWVHIQDGTGDQKKGTHNLVSTSQETPTVGEVVTIKGTLAKDRDFGGGYLYKVILEKATLLR